MSSENTTEVDAEPAVLLGQGELALPGIGEVWLVWSARGLVVLALPGGAPDAVESDLVELGLSPPPRMGVPEEYAAPLSAYAAGEDVEPAAIPVDLRGTDFQRRVWEALRRIPRGAVRSYQGIAQDVGSPRGMRAVGMANHHNRLAIVVPCHRVVEAGGRLGGYASGPAMKRRLLRLEGVSVQGDQVRPGQLDLWD